MKYWIIAKKEILDTARDKRTLLMMIVMPLLLVPTLIGTLMKIESSQREKASEQNPHPIPFTNPVITGLCFAPY